jgi:predicted membrane protein
MEELINWIFILATGLISWHGITYRDKEGEKDFVRLLFGCIALMFFLRVLFVDIFKIITISHK